MSNTVKRPDFKAKYDNYIGGKFTAPIKGNYFDVVSPIDGKVFTQAAHSTKEDIEFAVDTAHEAFKTWEKTSVTERSILLNKIAQKIEDNLEYIAAVETVDNGKPIRETLAADMPLVIDHFRYFASVIRAEESSIAELDSNTVSIALSEPLGVIAQIIPWNFPILMAVWKLAPALAAGNTVVLKPAESTPISILVLMELIGDILPPGVINIVNGFGAELGRHLVTNKKVSKAAFTGSTTTGRLVMQYATENIIPVTLELGGKSPNIFMKSVADHDDDFFDKAIEGAVMFALNQGEICTSPSRLLVHEDIYDKFMAKVIERTEAIVAGNPLDKTTMIGAQASIVQKEKIMSYLKLGVEEGAELLTGGGINQLGDDLDGGYYIQPTILPILLQLFPKKIFLEFNIIQKKVKI